MRRAYLIVCALFMAHAPTAALAAPAANGAPLDPQNLIADDIQAEALWAYGRAAAQKPFRGTEIVIVDYRMPTDARRLFILDLTTGRAEAHYVAHGRGSDPGHTRRPQRFSDVMSTGMSSVGAYRGLERYTSGAHGPALKLAGLSSTNASAYERLIVFHTAGYFAPDAGRFGRSCGCFVVTTQDMKRVYDVIADGGFLYAGPAALHDKTANFQRDCNTECGNTCPEPLIADARPANPPVVTRVAEAQPAPAEPISPPPASSIVVPPQPRAKPAFPTAIAMARPVADDTPLPLSKPDFGAAPEAQQSAAADISPDPEFAAPPLPLSKPDFGSLDVQTVAIPDVAPGEIPVPAAKPGGLQQVAVLDYAP